MSYRRLQFHPLGDLTRPQWSKKVTWESLPQNFCHEQRLTSKPNLGSYIATDKDITNQQQLTWAAVAKLRKCRKINPADNLEIAIWTFFFYNSVLWSLTNARKKEVGIIIILLSVRLIDNIKNEKLYGRLNTEPCHQSSKKDGWLSLDTLANSHLKLHFENVSIKHPSDGVNRREGTNWHGRSFLRLACYRTTSTQVTRQPGNRWKKEL